MLLAGNLYADEQRVVFAVADLSGQAYRGESFGELLEAVCSFLLVYAGQYWLVCNPSSQSYSPVVAKRNTTT